MQQSLQSGIPSIFPRDEEDVDRAGGPSVDSRAEDGRQPFWAVDNALGQYSKDDKDDAECGRREAGAEVDWSGRVGLGEVTAVFNRPFEFRRTRILRGV